MQKPEEILYQYWRFRDFRPMQREIITAALENKDSIALLPTGGGKSLCFQIPGMVKDGICLVISPLVALMEDQVNALNAKGIKALAITGGIKFSELDTLLDNCIYGNYKFLYLSPERLQQDLVKERIKQMKVSMVAIDEAHCISQWGHDFRPAYLSISELRELIPEVPFMALTASATKTVIKDISEKLKLDHPSIFKNSLNRPNIAFDVVFSEDKMYKLGQLLKDKNESVIIYVRSRSATLEISNELSRIGLSSEAFHGGLTNKDKSARLDRWLKEKTKIIVATTAFGMGIDKANVRKVVHLNLPESLESYFQEAGRAGRDGDLSQAIIISNKSDIPVLKNQFINSLPDLEFVKLIYKKLNSYFQIAFGEGINEVFDFNFGEFCNRYQLNSVKAYNALQTLDRISVIRLSQQFQKVNSVKFIISNKQLFYYLEENPRFENVVKSILRTYGGIFENEINVNLNSICQKAGTNEKEVIEVLKKLDKDKIVEFMHQENDASITFLVPREDETTIYPFATYINNQVQDKKEKVFSVLKYVENDETCRMIQLLSYFGENIKNPCGICSVCKKEFRKLDKTSMKVIYHTVITSLENGEQSSRELAAQIDFPEEWTLKVLRLMLEKNIIKTTPTNNYKLKHL